MVEQRTQQQLQHRRRAAAARQAVHGDRRQRGAGRVAADAEALRVDPVIGRMGLDVDHRRQRVLDRRRETVFRSQAVIHRQHPAAAGIGKRGCDRVVTRRRTRHQTAAVKVDQTGQQPRRRVLGRVQSRGQIAGRSRDAPLLQAVERWRGAREFHELQMAGAPLRGARRQDARRVARVQDVQKALDARIERHGRPAGQTPRARRVVAGQRAGSRP